MLARMDLEREGQPFFRIYPFADPPRAEHERWDDGDMTGRYVEGLLRARAMTGLPIDPREALLRQYLAGLFDENNGLCYTRQAEWTPRRACLFSQSSAMLGLLAWRLAGKRAVCMMNPSGITAKSEPSSAPIEGQLSFPLAESVSLSIDLIMLRASFIVLIYSAREIIAGLEKVCSQEGYRVK